MSWLDLLAPELCVICRRPCSGQGIFSGFCRQCLQDLPWRFQNMVLDWPQENQPPTGGLSKAGVITHPSGRLLKLRVACTYEAPLQHLLLQLKFRGQTGLALPLAGLGLHALRAGDAYDYYDGVVAVPLHVSRLKERGYNQAHLLAEPIAARLKCADLSAYLRRTRATERQSQQISRSGRFVNLAQAFELAGPSCPATRSAKSADCTESGMFRQNEASIWQNRRILLVDDVMTTGATLLAAAQPLLQVGALVEALVIASDFATAPDNRNRYTLQFDFSSQTGENTLY